MQSNCSQMVVLASIFAVLVVSTQAIDLTRLYDHHNKRELVVGKLLFFSPKMASLCMISNVWYFFGKTFGYVVILENGITYFCTNCIFNPTVTILKLAIFKYISQFWSILPYVKLGGQVKVLCEVLLLFLIDPRGRCKLMN